MKLDGFFQRLWYERRYPLFRWLLLPLSWLFRAVVWTRRCAYRAGWLTSVRIERPVLVIGNLTVGGTGKTPLVLWLANECARRGVKAAIICRGFGGTLTAVPMAVSPDSDPHEVGDEAVLLAQGFPGTVIAGADRVAAAAQAVKSGADVILCDDGLQHYRLQRDAEIIVLDGGRLWGNGHLLPAGPLREPPARARTAQLIALTQRGDDRGTVTVAGVRPIELRMRLDAAVSLTSGESRPLTSFAGEPVHALAAIGNPQAFFAMLRAHGLSPDTRVLPDHAVITARDVDFGDAQPVLMTDKDAVKCRAFADSRLWRVPLRVEMSAEHQAALWRVVEEALRARQAY
jgi:tetraacyldisaccharide 4'-kinase